MTAAQNFIFFLISILISNFCFASNGDKVCQNIFQGHSPKSKKTYYLLKNNQKSQNVFNYKKSFINESVKRVLLPPKSEIYKQCFGVCYLEAYANYLEQFVSANLNENLRPSRFDLYRIALLSKFYSFKYDKDSYLELIEILNKNNWSFDNKNSQSFQIFKNFIEGGLFYNFSDNLTIKHYKITEFRKINNIENNYIDRFMEDFYMSYMNLQNKYLTKLMPESIYGEHAAFRNSKQITEFITELEKETKNLFDSYQSQLNKEVNYTFVDLYHQMKSKTLNTISFVKQNDSSIEIEHENFSYSKGTQKVINIDQSTLMEIIKSHIDKNYPIFLGSYWPYHYDKSFKNFAKFLKPPKIRYDSVYNEYIKEISNLIGHATVIVGYELDAKNNISAIIIRNTHGIDFGDNGHRVISFSELLQYGFMLNYYE